MSHESVPEHAGQTGQAAHDHVRQEPAPAASAQGGAPKGLLQQMEELMAALNADLSQLDADLQSSQPQQSSPASQAPQSSPASPSPQLSQSSVDRTPGTPTAPGGPAPDSERPTHRSL
ncbi:hypothetical protein ABZ128_09730 [Streptomyces sp. NPDC006326]|uniref:hypothetical protein n=1 Tax=Streptomyces sp. NPDC006326 TaxID=3156752 RepID=UPI0033B377BE